MRQTSGSVIAAVDSVSTQLTSGEQAHNAKLDELIGKQGKALALAKTQAASLKSLASLVESQATSLKSISKTVQSQLDSIKVVTLQGVISLTQALSLFKSMRRNKLLTERTSMLANLPCSTLPTDKYPLVINNSMPLVPQAARKRTLGLNNRVVGGLLLHTWRSSERPCPESKFGVIHSVCAGQCHAICHETTSISCVNTSKSVLVSCTCYRTAA